MSFVNHKEPERHEESKSASEPNNGVGMATRNGKKVVKERKRVITTVYQQIEYFDDDEDIGDGMSKHVILDNGEVRRKKPANKSKTEGILHQINALIKCLDLTSLSASNGNDKS